MAGSESPNGESSGIHQNMVSLMFPFLLALGLLLAQDSLSSIGSNLNMCIQYKEAFLLQEMSKLSLYIEVEVKGNTETQLRECIADNPQC